MATNFSNTLHMSNTSTTDLRAWIQFIDNTLITTGGWVNTTDTGQLTIASATSPGAVNTKIGYRVYRMNDTLQGSSPVFMRIDYGSNSSSASNPAMWLTIGTGSNGAGTITGIVFNGGAVTAATVASTPTSGTNACDSYGSADTNRVSLLMFARAGANDIMELTIERTKDSSGNDTGTGLLLTYTNAPSTGGVDTTQVLLLAGGSQPPVESGVSLILSNRASSAFTSNIGVGLAMFFESVAIQPGVGFIAVNDGDFIAEATVTMSVYGSTRTYQLSNSSNTQLRIPTGNATVGTRANTRVGIRYD